MGIPIRLIDVGTFNSDFDYKFYYKFIHLSRITYFSGKKWIVSYRERKNGGLFLNSIRMSEIFRSDGQIKSNELLELINCYVFNTKNEAVKHLLDILNKGENKIIVASTLKLERIRKQKESWSHLYTE